MGGSVGCTITRSVYTNWWTTQAAVGGWVCTLDSLFTEGLTVKSSKSREESEDDLLNERVLACPVL